MMILIWLTIIVASLIVLVRFDSPVTSNLSFTAQGGVRSLPTLPWPRHQMHKSLKAYQSQKISDTDFAIHYHIGNDFCGETDFRLQGNGTYDLWTTVTNGRQKKSYSGQVAVCEVEQVVEEMLANRIWQVRHIYPMRALDDPGAKIAIEAANQKFEVMLWASEIEESPPFAAVQGELLSLIHEVSQGQVLG